MLDNFSRFCCRLLTFFKITFFKKLFQEHYQSGKRIESRSGPTFSLTRSKLFEKIISRWQKSPPARKEFNYIILCLKLYVVSVQIWVKLFAKVISRQQKSLLVRKLLCLIFYVIFFYFRISTFRSATSLEMCLYPLPALLITEHLPVFIVMNLSRTGPSDVRN